MSVPPPIEPDASGTLRGVASLLMIGLVLGLAFNAMGRISKPQHGIPWTSQPDSVATLESYQAAPASPAAATVDLPMVPDVPGPIELGLASLKKLWDAKAVLIVDARERDVYEQGHIAGAINVPYSEVADTLASARKVDAQGRPIVVYCSGVGCQSSLDLADILVEMGKRRVLVYRGGYPEWQTAGYPTATGAAPGDTR